MNSTGVSMRENIESIFRSSAPRARATLVRLLGDLDLADDALQDAFAAALDRWPATGIPDNPVAWLISTARFKGIDAIRKSARSSEALDEDSAVQAPIEEESLVDDELRLIFLCCHPALSMESQVSLTLREVCELTTEEVARAFLVTTPTMAQRIARAKAKIRADRLPFEVPFGEGLRARLDGVLKVAYLLYNEGYYASFGEAATRRILSEEAIRLAQTLANSIPDSEVHGLLALMLLNESRRQARTTPEGDLILLEDQDRSLWNREVIAEGAALARQALESPIRGAYAFQAAIAAVHAQSGNPESTDWKRIVDLYDELFALQPTSIVALNRAVAIGMCDGPQVAIDLIDDLIADGGLADYQLAYAARADFLRRSGRWSEAIESYRAALDRSTLEPEKRFLQRRIDEMSRKV